jgi:hypothetical protein
MPQYVIEIDKLTKIYQTGKTQFKALNKCKYENSERRFCCDNGSFRIRKRSQSSRHWLWPRG